MELQSKVILITGASGALGASMVKAFLQTGARVVGVSRSITASEFAGDHFTAMPANISTVGDTRALVNNIVETFRRVDAAIHLVGAFAGGERLEATGDEVFQRMLEVNYYSAVHLINAALPVMRRQGEGSIIVAGSRAAVEPAPMAAAYAASKAALLSLIRAAAAENKSYGIRANAILPGTMDTPANRKAMPDADPSQWVSTEDVASLAVQLAMNPSITGALVPIYGVE
jgi:NAD(P)-dependent dehydrogenase (short-subunit alcohol dehydrogenase family)